MCAIHQPNLLPRLATLAKLFAADCWIVLEDVQFTRRYYQHRARLAALDNPDRRQWLTIPTHLPRGRQTLIREARIADPDLARRRTAALLRQHYGSSPHWPVFAEAMEPVLAAFDTGRTAAVAEITTRVLLNLVGWSGQVLSSSQLPARTGRTQRLADLASSTAARTYLCGTGGMTYLQPHVFTARAITVTPFRTPSSGIWVSARQDSSVRALMALGPTALADELQTAAALSKNS